MRLDTAQPELPVVRADNQGHVYVAWIDHRTGDSQFNLARSSDYGASWAPENRIDHAPTGVSQYPISMSNDRHGHVYAVWHYTNPDTSLGTFFNVSADYGATWQPSDRRVDAAPSSHLAHYAQLTNDEVGRVYVTWVQEGYCSPRCINAQDIYLNASGDFGTTWGQAYRIDGAPDATSQDQPLIAADQAGHAHVVWKDNRLSTATLDPAVRPFTTSQRPMNRPPTMEALSDQSVLEGQLLSFTVAASDPDGDPLTFSAESLPAGAAFDPGSRTFSWTPSFEQAGSYSVTFAASDGSLSASETMTITVVNVNRAPVLNPIVAKSVNEGQLLSFTVSAADPDGDALTYTASPLPAGASFDAAAQTFSWTPTIEQVGSYTVTFTVSDGLLSAAETVTITVTNVNRAPVLAPIGNKTVKRGNLLTFTLSASDPDGQTLTYSASGLPSGATLNPTTGAFSWKPGNNQVGTYTITFRVSDGALTDAETITITVIRK